MPDEPSSQSLDLSADSPPMAWTQNWQMPALLLGMAMVAMGVILTLPSSEPEDYDGSLDSVQAFLRAGNLDGAEQKLKLDGAMIQAEQVPGRIKGRYWQLWGDLAYDQIQMLNLSKAEFHQKVLGYYSKASEHGQAFDGEHLRRWAATLVSLDRLDDALKKIEEVELEDRGLKWQLIQQIVNQQIDRHEDAPTQLTPWLVRFFEEVRLEADAARRRKAAIWGVTLHAKILLEARDADKVIQFLHLKYVRFRDEGTAEDLGPLQVRLAQAYQQNGQYKQARQWFEQARQLLAEEDELNVQILVGLAQIMLAESGDVRQVQEIFASAATRYSDSEEYLDALIGQADREARLGEHVQAIKNLRQAATQILAVKHPRPRHKTLLVDVARSHYESLFGQDQYDQALEYLSTLTPVFGEKLPARVLADFALIHEKIAVKRQAEARKLARTVPIDEIASAENIKAMRLANQEAAIEFGRSADYFYEHALAVTISDDEAHGNSLWRAGLNYDRAQMWPRAIGAYNEFVRVRASDSRFHAAVNHLGKAYQADGQNKVAAKLFKELIERHPKSEAAHRSLVPMAQCFIAMGELDQARRTLEHVLQTHDAITPQSETYRDALIELGKLHYSQSHYLQAITRLEEAIDEKRYGNTEQGASLRYRLADAYRQSVHEIDTTLVGPMSQSRRQALEKQRKSNLQRAAVLYSQSINEFESRHIESLTALEKTFYRNAYFYRGDCAYDQKNWEQAITLYDLAAKRWENHPASLVALVQIVNSYCELGATQEAKAANDRARYQLKRISDEAFNDPNLPMDRKHWEDWLRWTNELDLFASR